MNQIRDEVRTRGVRFILVGILNSAFGYAVYSACIYLGLGYFGASTTAMLLGIMFNYRTIGTLVFKRQAAPFWRFAVSYLLVLGFTVLLLEASGRLGIDPYLAGLLAAVPSAGVSYFLQRQFVFTKLRSD
ncbi:GtrA family protein [Devosia sp. YR412]|uniref:GtrA family protein n=1 Tax=Devosia sp. YR412 TaxID=1881030 RepID=UPI001481B3B3|nr:GtrA family protein [Devosia sp. YR412]